MPRNLPLMPNTVARRVNEQIEPLISGTAPILSEDQINRASQISVDIENEVDTITIGLQDIDNAVFYYFNNVIKPIVIQNGTELKVPVIYGSQERWVSVQRNGYYRDKNGNLMYPIIMLKRTGFEKDRSIGNKLDGNNVNNFVVSKARYNSQNQYNNFAILNNTIPSEKFYLTSVPDYVTVTYDCLISTNFIEQNNKIIESIEFASDSYWGDKNKFQFRTYIDRFDSTNEYSINEERVAKTSLSITLHGYLLPDNLNKDMATNGKKQFYSKSIVNITTETVKNINNLREL
jgi:hypothetical protein